MYVRRLQFLPVIDHRISLWPPSSIYHSDPEHQALYRQYCNFLPFLNNGSYSGVGEWPSPLLFVRVGTCLYQPGVRSAAYIYFVLSVCIVTSVPPTAHMCHYIIEMVHMSLLTYTACTFIASWLTANSEARSTILTTKCTGKKRIKVSVLHSQKRLTVYSSWPAAQLLFNYVTAEIPAGFMNASASCYW